MNSWQKAKVIKIREACSDIKSLTLTLEDPTPFKAGQHYEICMPGENVIRKYSVVSPMQDNTYLEFGIQLIENGSLSPKLWNLKEGDEVEIRGPISSYFTWDASNPAPLVLLGAGSGITTLLSIYYSHKYYHPQSKTIFIMSAKDETRIMNYDSLKEILITRFTKKEPRIDKDFLREHIGELLLNNETIFYICGLNDFVNDMRRHITNMGIKEESIQTEVFI